MYLSLLQRSILLECREQATSRQHRSAFLRYYENSRSHPSARDQSRSERDFANDRLSKRHRYGKAQQDAVTKSLERLIDKGLLIGYGRRTPKKWFMEEVRLTAKGRREATKLLGEQQELPLKNVKLKIHNSE